MRVAAFVHSSLRSHVRCAVQPPDKLIEAESWPGMVAILIDKRVDVAVVDPGAAGWNGLGAAVDLLLEFPGVPVLGYMVADATTATTIITLVQHRVREVPDHGRAVPR